MLFIPLLIPLLAVLPNTLSAPVSVQGYNNCGFVLTKPEENVHAGLTAFDACTHFFYNTTIEDYQDAYAFNLFGGCKCGFYVEQNECETHVNSGPFLDGPTRGEYWETIEFAEPKPKWYNCFQI
ncbi:hypothetical protein BKA66DRAFT_568987 [Pyrenochaeta sp. MPI-SDFR-AT-0127]|nr:hypothetical protein BKA66DRAFT_568987 [Pyrenochaeta sp. MPI-SDFR-AT-0127]